VQAIDPLADHDQLWNHSTRSWAFDMGMLVVTGGVWTGLLSWRPHRLGRRMQRRFAKVPLTYAD
jgi:hypothetical protein